MFFPQLKQLFQTTLSFPSYTISDESRSIEKESEESYTFPSQFMCNTTTKKQKDGKKIVSFQPLPTSLCCLTGCTDQNQHAQLQRSHQGVLTHFVKVVNLHFESLGPPLQVFYCFVHVMVVMSTADQQP